MLASWRISSPPGRSPQYFVAFRTYSTNMIITCSHERQLNKTTTVATTTAARMNITYIKYARFGLNGRTPVVLNRLAARTRGKKT